jgi:hypothetical protein
VVAIIQNPATGGGYRNPSGDTVGEALNGIAGAFINAGTNQAAAQKARQDALEFQQKQAAQNTIADAFTHLNDQSQDHTQDAPDYATPQPREFSLSSPEDFNRAVMTLGNPAEIGKALQLSAGLNGGINDPSVAVGSLPGGGYAQTPAGITNANQLAIQKSAADAQSGAAAKPYVYTDPVTGQPQVTNEAIAAGGLPGGGLPQQSTDQQKATQLNRMVFNPAAPDGGQPVAPTDDQRIALGLDSNKTTPYNINWTDAAGQKHTAISSDPAADVNKLGIGQFNPIVTSAAGGGTTVNVGEQGSFNKEFGTEQAKDVIGKIKAGDAAGPVVEGTNEALGALKNIIAGGGTTGVGAQGIVQAKSLINTIANSFGLPQIAGDLSDPNVFTKATNGIAMNALKQLVQGAGGRITNMEVQQFKTMNPGWDLSPDGNLRMLDLINQAAVRDQGLGQGFRKIAANAARSGGSPNPADFADFEAQYMPTHHLIDPVDHTDYTVAALAPPSGAATQGVQGQQQPQGVRGVQGQPQGAQGQQRAPSPGGPLPGALAPEGARQAPDGNWYVPDPSRSGKYLRVDGGSQ